MSSLSSEIANLFPSATPEPRAVEQPASPGFDEQLSAAAVSGRAAETDRKESDGDDAGPEETGSLSAAPAKDDEPQPVAGENESTEEAGAENAPETNDNEGQPDANDDGSSVVVAALVEQEAAAPEVEVVTSEGAEFVESAEDSSQPPSATAEGVDALTSKESPLSATAEVADVATPTSPKDQEAVTPTVAPASDEGELDPQPPATIVPPTDPQSETKSQAANTSQSSSDEVATEVEANSLSPASSSNDNDGDGLDGGGSEPELAKQDARTEKASSPDKSGAFADEEEVTFERPAVESGAPQAASTTDVSDVIEEQATGRSPGSDRTDNPAPLARLAAGKLPASRAEAAGGDTPAPRVDAARFIGRVGRAFETAQQRGGEVRLRLSPPELGSLQIKLTLSDGTLAASMETETAAARNVLLDNLPALRERLAEQEIRIEKFDVDVRDEGRGGDTQDWQPEQRREARSAETKGRGEQHALGGDDRDPSEAAGPQTTTTDGAINFVA